MYFALCGGENHHELCHSPSQLTFVESHVKLPYIRYTEDVLKTNHSGLKHQKQKKKEVVHYANTANPKRCLIRLYKLFNSHCPYNHLPSVFYLKPLPNPKEKVWYSIRMQHTAKHGEMTVHLC